MAYGSMSHASKVLFVSWHRGAINVLKNYTLHFINVIFNIQIIELKK
jgi:hypothetical protein